LEGGRQEKENGKTLKQRSEGGEHINSENESREVGSEIQSHCRRFLQMRGRFG
jgi:hypothetical protein